MADLEKTIEIVFQGNDQLSGSLSAVSDKISNLSGTVSNIAAPFADVGKRVLETDAALLALAAGGLAYAFDKAKTFQAAVIELQSSLKPGESIEDAKRAASQLGEAYGASSTALIGSLKAFEQAGYSLRESITITESALKLQIAGNMSAAESVEGLKRVMKGFNLEAEESAKVIDILVGVSKNYGVSVEELSKGMAAISPTAKSVGLSLEETVGLMTPMIRVFGSGEEAASSLTQTLIRFTNTGDKGVQEMIQKLTGGLNGFNVTTATTKEKLYAVMEGFGNLDKQQQLYATTELTGMRNGAKMATVFSNLSEVLKVSESALRSTGAATEEVKARLSSADHVVEVFKNAFDGLAKTIGDQFLLSAAGAIAGATQIEKALKTAVSSDSFKPVFDALNGFGVSLEDWFRGVAKALPEALNSPVFQNALKNFVESLKGLGTEVSGLFGSLDLTKPEDLAVALGKAADVMSFLVNVTKGMVEAFKPFISGLIETAVSLSKMDDGTSKSIGKLLGLAMVVKDVFGQIMLAIEWLSDNSVQISAVFDVISGSIKFLFNSALLSVNLMALGVATALLAVVEPINKMLNVVGITKYNEEVDKLRNTVFKWSDDVQKTLAAQEAGWNQAAKGIENYSAEANKIPKEIGTKISAEGIEATKKQITDFSKNVAGYKIPPINVPILYDDSDLDKVVAGGWEKIKNPTPVVFKSQFDSYDFSKQLDGASQQIQEMTAKINKEAEEKPNRIKVVVGTYVDENGVEKEMSYEQIIDKTGKVKKAINDVPDKKVKLELENKLDVERIKSQTEVIGKMLDFKARIEVAELENDTKRIEAILGSVNTMFTSSSQVLQSFFGSLSGLKDLSSWNQDKVIGIAQDQVKNQQEAQKVAAKVADAQIDLMKSKADALKRGNGWIQIDSTGLEPDIASFMMKVLSKIRLQIAKQEDLFLLGIA